ASTPPAVGTAGWPRPRAACRSLGPLPFLGSQWSPTFWNECFSDAIAVWLARRPSPYCATADSYVFAHVRCAFFGDRRTVLGIDSSAGMTPSLGGPGPPQRRLGSTSRW